MYFVPLKLYDTIVWSFAYWPIMTWETFFSNLKPWRILFWKRKNNTTLINAQPYHTYICYSFESKHVHWLQIKEANLFEQKKKVEERGHSSSIHLHNIWLSCYLISQHRWKRYEIIYPLPWSSTYNLTEVVDEKPLWGSNTLSDWVTWENEYASKFWKSYKPSAEKEESRPPLICSEVQ